MEFYEIGFNVTLVIKPINDNFVVGINGYLCLLCEAKIERYDTR